MKLKIGDAIAFRRPEDWTYIPDDRQQRHETIHGVVVEDYGHVLTGDTITCTVILAYNEFLKVQEYYNTRELITVVDHAGKTWENVRVVIKKDSYVNRFESYHKTELEFWFK